MTNRVNSSGPSTGAARPAVSISAVIPAGETVSYPITGSQFYLVTATAPVQIKPDPGGAFVPYYQGTGQIVPGGFTLLQVTNGNSNDVVVQIVCSDKDYVDRRLLNNQVAQPYIVAPIGIWDQIFPGPPVVFALNCPDRSNSLIEDIQGNEWLAITRISINVQNTVANSFIQIFAGLYPETVPFVYVDCYSASQISPPYILACAGDFWFQATGTGLTANTLNAFEIYQCVQPGVNQIP